VATALAAESSELVGKLVVVDQAPDNSFGGLPFLAQLTYLPVLGELIYRVSPDALVEDGYSDAFAPGYDIASGFDNPDEVVDGYNAMTYTSYDRSPAEEDSYTEAMPLDQRLIEAAVPLLVIFGTEDQIYDAEEAVAAYEDVPGARTALIDGAGHSPNVEQPRRTARLILEFAQDPGDEAESPPRQGQ
jgi:pimeloyl-ACP methyl ester carboxylesterase